MPHLCDAKYLHPMGLINNYELCDDITKQVTMVNILKDNKTISIKFDDDIFRNNDEYFIFHFLIIMVLLKIQYLLQMF